jgi:hypothetical protein
MSDELERKRLWPNRGINPKFAWRAEENHEILSQNSRYPGRDSN